MKGSRLVSLAGAALLACSELPPLPPGVCGNSVVEAGEDCDRAVDPALGPATRCGDETDAARACLYSCADGALCPVGWACRVDGLCHHGTGRYEVLAAESVPWFGDAWSAGDVDGDGVIDVVGAAGAELRVVRGDGAGGLREALRRALPIGTEAMPATGDLDGDSRLDVIVPSPLGLVVLRGSARTLLEPVAYAPFSTAAGPLPAWPIPLRLVGLPSGHTPVLLADTAQGVSMTIWPTESVPIGTVRRCEGRSLADLPDRSVIADLDGDETDELVLAFAGDDEVALCRSFLDAFDESRSLAFGRQWISLGRDPEGQPFEVLQGALLADVDGDGAKDLLVSVHGDRVIWMPGDGAGGFGRPSLDPRFERAVGELPAPGWPLAADQLDGLGADDFVTPTGVWITDPDTAALVRTDEPFPYDTRWREAVVLDFDGRGLPDVAIADRDAPVVHLLLGGGVPGPHTPTNVPTEALPTLLRAGDFDGDLVEDLAFKDGDTGLSVLFGDTAQPVHVGSLPGLARMEIGALRYAPTDRITDIVVSVAPEADGRQRGAAFVGAASRVLESPLALLSTLTPSRPRAASVGRFLSPEPGDATSQLLAIAGPERSTSLWLVREALATPSATPARVASLAAFDTRCAQWVGGDIDADGKDELVGVWGDGCDPLPESAAIQVDLDSSSRASVVELAGRPAAGLRSLSLVDLDGDGAADLLRATATAIEIGWSDGATLDLGWPAILPAAPDGASPLFALPLQADTDVALELAVATGESIWIAEVAPDRSIAWGTEPAARLGATRLGAGDLDRDGLADLVAGDGTTLTPLRARTHLESAR